MDTMPVFEMAVTGFPVKLDAIVETRTTACTVDWSLGRCMSGSKKDSYARVTFVSLQCDPRSRTNTSAETTKRIVSTTEMELYVTPATEMITTKVPRPSGAFVTFTTWPSVDETMVELDTQNRPVSDTSTT